ncbi:MAG TPA: class I SAM-dependent methyltransferase [Candidatus Margulisiibacteriota bacterium]|nr:class I SAM-dependent methyltransferase [Candidatus Margulisiibacteriota bacterium]
MQELQLAAAIIDVARDLARTVPPPRGAPYFCLDSDAPYDLDVLRIFCERGIFRKYEFALDLGSGLGGRARWLAARSGCRILGVDSRPRVVAAAALLNRRVHMDDQVTFQVGQLECLPLRPRVFTHVWLVDVPDPAQLVAMCSEAYRVLRPGGHFALQCAASSPAVGANWVTALTEVGFVSLEVCAVELAELSPPCRLARDRLAVWSQGAARETTMRPAPAVQIFATRPA